MSGGMNTSTNSDLKPVIYIAGRFSDGGTLNKEDQWKNRDIMRYHSIKFMKKGWAVICPIENDEWAYEDGIITYDDTISSDLAIISKCDAIFFCPGWKKGKGTLIEHKFASEHNIPILYKVRSANDEFVNQFVVNAGPPIPDLTTDELDELFSDDNQPGNLSLDDYRNIVQKQKEKSDGKTG
jgi:hypothetical protein